MNKKIVVFMLFISVLTLVFPVTGQTDFKPTKSYPRLTITKVTIVKNKSKPLSISFVLQCVGETPIRLAQHQFYIQISSENDPYLFLGNTVFSKNYPPLFALDPNQQIALTLTTLRNRLSPKQIWSALRSGKYKMRINVDGSKTRDFDYQWQGSTFSDEYILKIK